MGSKMKILYLSGVLLSVVLFNACGGVYGARKMPAKQPLHFNMPADRPWLDEADMTRLDRQLDGANILDIQALVTEGALSYERLTLYYLQRIRDYDNKLNSIIELNPEALELARSRDNERNEQKTKHGEVPLMYGIPVLLKDNISTAGQLHTTAGALAMKGFAAGKDAKLVTRLRESGAIILGKANLSEWANAMADQAPNGYSALGGQTRNPYRLSLNVGGSSSGSAVSVAAEFSTVSIGTETSGSIINPSSLNSVYGMRPGGNLVPQDMVIPITDHLDTPGPMARNITDLAITLSVIASGQTDYREFLDPDKVRERKLRIGFAVNLPSYDGREFDLDDEQLAALKDLFDRAGIAFLPIEYQPQFGEALQNGFFSAFYQGLRTDIETYFVQAGVDFPIGKLRDIVNFNMLDPDLAIPYGQGQFIAALSQEDQSPEELERVFLAGRTEAIADMEAMFRSGGSEPPDIVAGVGNSLSLQYVMADYTALSVPIGYGGALGGSYEKGFRPLNITLVSKAGSEGILIAAAYALERQLEQLETDSEHRESGLGPRKRPALVFRKSEE
ncbi:amidase family protein [Candidatus Haliotispira prima]|uniref:Amidase family protein n=1 Tax=Candidatus Haliotispira prima TaxID=3034016 RepID=A0ABY8MFU1_9SPIO|nr:amidase family protein [Candidatus Haliotispira prima]